MPPNTTEKIALRYTDDEVHWRMGTDVQTPSETHLAWMPWSDWIAFLAAPSVVEVTAEDVRELVGCFFPEDRDASAWTASLLNKKLRARATTAPRSLEWITGERMCKSRWSSLIFSRLADFEQKEWNDAAARLREIGGGQ